MIVRKYNRRSRSLSRSCSDSGFDEAIASDEYENSLSQESPQDIYDFAFSSQDSASHWSFDSESYVSNSSQEARQLTVLPPRKPLIGGDIENGDGAFRMSKKPRNSLDFDPYGLNSSQESRKLAVLPTKKVNGADWENGNGCLRKQKKVKNGSTKELKSKGVVSFSVPLEQTKTLMETQEFGEMMEHEDEVYFALDGLRKGQPARIRRASLLTLLSICGTAQQRRLLRTNGTAKTILDAVVGLSFDDPPSNLAAAALFYILTSDGQEDLMDSPSSIHFLMKMLKTLPSSTSNNKAPTIGCKLLALRKNASYLHDINGADSTSAAIVHKVQEILVSCKQMKSRDGKDNGREKPELSPKWISLLTMEKACLSIISFEETSGNVRKTGGNFKENFREHGGLDVVFDVARTCHSNMERWLEELSSQIVESKDDVNLESLVLLLKCLKIMENATFLSQDNQSHLLKMKSKFNSQHQPQSFTKLMLSIIKILSGVSLLISSSGSSGDEKLCSSSNETCHATERPVMVDNKEGSNEILSISSSMECCSMQWTPSQKSSNISHNSHWLASNQLGVFKSSSSVTTTTCPADTSLLKIRASSSTPSSCNGTLSWSNSETRVSNNSWTKFGIGKTNKVSEDTKFELIDDNQDPFAFREDEFEPSKWDLLSGRQKVSQNRKKGSAVGVHENGCQSLLTLGQQEEPIGILGQQEEPSSMESQNSSQLSCSPAVDAEKSNLLSDCLLTAVKVLMNLTNDNSVGCQQIAACGGLEILSSLIAGHFPSFSSYLPPFIEIQKHGSSSKSGLEFDQQNDRHLTDEELDFLVAILGLLVNLVEKDGRNRSRLAATSISFPSLKGSEDECRDVIPLLCSIFLANHGAGEAAEEGRNLPSDDEDALLQGEKEAEKMIVEAYSALLLAFLSTESKSIRNVIAECLPDHNLAILVPVLERFVEFHLTLNMISPETHTAVLEVIESCRMP